MRNALLALLANESKHGLLLKQELDVLLGPAAGPINVGQIYVTLQRLERDGLIARHEVEQAGRRNKTEYSLTGAGLEELKDWLGSPSSDQRLRDDFVLKLAMAAKTGQAEPSALIARQRAHYFQSLSDLDRLSRSVDGSGESVERLLIEGAALHLQADLKWLDLCEEQFVAGERR